MISPDRLRAAYVTARDALLAERVPAGHWVGELSTSALSTATAVVALHVANPFEHRDLIDHGIRWLAAHQNLDGGWGDTVKSISNVSTAMLCRSALAITGAGKDHPATVDRVEDYLTSLAGKLPARRADAIRRRYGKDHTFSVPILMTSALAGLVPWDEVPRLPFEAAALPQSWYRLARMPVVSYALPALIAIGQCVHAHRRGGGLLRGLTRRLVRGRTLRVLRRIQPTSGGYLEATPLTSFVVMALCSIRRRRRPEEQQVIDEGLRFLVNSVRPDGSWPIDTNLATWVTTLSVNALAAARDLRSLDTKRQIHEWLYNQQYTARHPYTGADPGGWAWTDLPGGVPDADDTPGSLLAIQWFQIAEQEETNADISWDYTVTDAGRKWLLSLQNRDGGFPTFCRGWGTLPFDRSGADLTAHALRVIGQWREPELSGENCTAKETAAGLAYLAKEQRADGSWLPLWFGNQHAPDDVNPVYGTSRVLAAYRDLGMKDAAECQRGVGYLLSVQNADGGWGGAKGCPSSVEETALAVEVLLDLASPSPGGEAPPPSPQRGEGQERAVERGLAWLVEAVESGRFRDPSPIGFYFAKLWYFEKLYPLIFTVGALGRAVRQLTSSPAAGSA
jgi:squalene-hopene/tetraprenyl-beta-curcumene cyclase